MDICSLWFFAIISSPCIKVFQTIMEKIVYTRSGMEGLLPDKFWMDPTKGQASLQGKMGQELLLRLLGVPIQREAHEWDLCLEGASKQAQNAENKLLVQPVDRLFHPDGGSAETQLSWSTVFHSGAVDTERVELGRLVFNQGWSSCPFCSFLFQYHVYFSNKSTPFLTPWVCNHPDYKDISRSLSATHVHHRLLSWYLF